MEKTSFQKEEDLLNTLSILEEYYNKDSPKYKFQHTFYNIQSVSEFTCVPILIRGHSELNNRISQQNTTVAKLDEACKALEIQVNHLVAKAEILGKKVDECVTECRKLYSARGDLDKVFRLRKMLLFKVRRGVGIDREKKKAVMQVLEHFRDMLLRLREKAERRNAGSMVLPEQ